VPIFARLWPTRVRVTVKVSFTTGVVRLAILATAGLLVFLSYSHVSHPCNNILLRTQLLYNLPLAVNGISLLVSNGTNYLNFLH